MNDQEQRVKAHCDANYARDLPARGKKLGEEYGELFEAIANGDRAAILEEAADCAILLADIVALLGESLAEAVETKLLIIMLKAHREKARL